jgi:hypothetical protein
VKPTRRLSVRCVCVIAFWCASVAPVLAQPVIFVERDPYAQDQGAPWGLPEELLERLALRAAEYEAAASEFECSETTQRVKYPRGRAAEGATREATYTFAFADGSITPVSVHGSGKSVKRYGKSNAPPAHAWTQLFTKRNQPYFAYRDLGEVPHAFGKARKIQFRGSLPYSDGADVRQWEGTVLIDPYSLQPLELDAQPLHLWPRLERQRREYVRSFKIAFFGLLIRFKKRPIAERVHVRFDVQSNGMTLPTDAHVERFEMTSPDQAVVRSRMVIRYAHDFNGDDPNAAP